MKMKYLNKKFDQNVTCFCSEEATDKFIYE